jgi:hypothetical protein
LIACYARVDLPAVSAAKTAGTPLFATLMKETFMDGTETRTQRPRREPDSKSSLIARAQQGEEAAFFALYELHKTRVYSICLRTAGTAQAAERLTQNIFLGVFRTISVVRNERELVKKRASATLNPAVHPSARIGFGRKSWEFTPAHASGLRIVDLEAGVTPDEEPKKVVHPGHFSRVRESHAQMVAQVPRRAGVQSRLARAST